MPCSSSAVNSTNNIVLQLQGVPVPQLPIFVGNYILDSQGFYEKFIEYRYEAILTNPNGSARTDLPALYYTINLQTQQLTLNVPQPYLNVSDLGSVSGQSNDYFNLPVYPTDAIIAIYVDRGAAYPHLYATAWTYDRELGTVVVPSIPGALSGQPLYVIYTPAVRSIICY